MKFGPVSSEFVKEIYIAFVINLAYFASGIIKGFVSFLIPQLRYADSQIHTTEDEDSWIGSLSTITSPIGCLVAGALMEACGRKYTLISMYIPCLASWIILWFAGNVYMLYFGMFLNGIFSGMVFCTATYLTELCTASHRGQFIALGDPTFGVGVGVGNILAYELGWRMSTIYLFTMTFICTLLTLTMPESPNFLISNGYLSEAKKVLQSVRRTETEIRKEMLELEQHYAELKRKEKKGFLHTLKNLLQAWKQFLIVISIFTLLQLVGHSIIIGYSVIFFENMNIPFDSNLASVIYSIVYFGSSILATVVTSYCSRKSSYTVSGIGVTISLLTAAVYESFYFQSDSKPFFWIVLGSIYVYNIFLIFGLLAIPYIMASELFPSHIAGISCGICGCIGYFIAGVILKIFPPLLSKFGMTTVLYILTFFAFITIPFGIFLLPETKDKTVNEVQKQYFSKNNISEELPMKNQDTKL